MQKKILRRGTLQLPCNQAKPGAALSSWGINMPTFCREFNAKTSNQETGKIVNVKIEVSEDKSYKFEIKGTPTSLLLKNLLKNKNEKTISSEELDRISQIKMSDLNTEDLESVKKTILGSLKSAGIKVEN
ncbi:MAG: 50S ribosomal protein L11 [Mycoplasmataceae bacterium]|nr:MAG: 50S ribosomal protein L11 [Mycoplasmataceae bacterium]